ncbi:MULTISPECIES: OpgC family protein [unclassified Roseovarius]|uniref:OpgC family protein n=1 Tax=unclassified Roseovarius TaxID=2614913 RepID=UPI00273E5E65|nr:MULTISPECIES: OpgC domain-containing protein [unclassified Roseovarius]
MPRSAKQDILTAKAAPLTGVRDPRLDFFRGIAMFIILIAHTPGNWLTLWIPARFGFSDATETFVFCSGMASAIAFGKAFRDRGMALGTARVAFRCWQVYWAHICLFFAIAATMVALNAALPDGRNYIGQLNLFPFFKNPTENLLGLLTLTYVPNYFDILPMYLVILAMMPLMVALQRVHIGLMAAVSVAIWLSAQIWHFNLPAEPWSERGWFFNPFGWQLVFFTGFSLMSGWIPAPPVDKRLFWTAVAIIVITLPFAYFRLYNEFAFFKEWRKEWAFLINKTDFGILRYVHFLATAYVAWVLVGPKGVNILPPAGDGVMARVWRRTLAIIMKVGQQSLAVFVASMFLARLLGVGFDLLGKSHLTMLLINGVGFALIIAVAYGAGWFKSQPWRVQKA